MYVDTSLSGLNRMLDQNQKPPRAGNYSFASVSINKLLYEKRAIKVDIWKRQINWNKRHQSTTSRKLRTHKVSEGRTIEQSRVDFSIVKTCFDYQLVEVKINA